MGTRAKKAVSADARKITYRNEEGKDVSIPNEEIERWELLSALQLKKGFNKNGFVDKMVAGYLMDSETTRRFLVIVGLGNLRKMEDVLDELRERVVVEKRTLCEEEIGMITGMAKVSESFTLMMESIIKISGARTNKVIGLPNLKLPEGVPPQEAPAFYGVNVTVNSNGQNAEKPAISVEQVPAGK